MDNENLYQQCRSLVPMSSMRPDHLAAAVDAAVELRGCEGDDLFHIDQTDDFIYYLLSGEMLLKHQSGRERIITADFHWFPIVQFQAEQFSATALTDYHVLKFEQAHLDSHVTWSQVADYLEIDIAYERSNDQDVHWMNTILNSNLFYKIPPLNALNIFSKISSIEVKKDSDIIVQGTEGKYCYFLKEGRASVSHIDVATQKETPLAEIGMGRCFGEDALINKTTRNASVKMLTDGVLIRLHRDDFEQLLIDPASKHVQTKTLCAMQEGSFEYLDVRTQEEFDYRHFHNALHIPLRLLRLKVRLLKPDVHYLVYCNTGVRSNAAAYLLAQKGLKVTVLEKGLGGLSQTEVNECLVDEFEEFHRLASSAG